MSTPIDVYAAARLWAEQHGHQAPDDRLIDLAYTAGRADVALEIRDALAGVSDDTSSGEAIWEQTGYRAGLQYAAEIAEDAR